MQAFAVAKKIFRPNFLLWHRYCHTIKAGKRSAELLEKLALIGPVR